MSDTNQVKNTPSVPDTEQATNVNNDDPPSDAQQGTRPDTPSEVNESEDAAFKDRQLTIENQQLKIASGQFAINAKIARYTLALVVLGVIGSFVSYMSADAARKSADIARGALLIGQRPWVGFDGNPISRKLSAVDTINNLPDGSGQRQRPTLGKKLEWSIEYKIKNFGTSPALHTVMSIDISNAGDFKTLRNIGARGCAEGEQLALGGGDVARGYTIFPGSLSAKNDTVSIGDLDYFQKGAVYWVGCIVYTDQFEIEKRIFHRTMFCFYAPSESVSVAGQELVPCFWGQDTD